MTPPLATADPATTLPDAEGAFAASPADEAPAGTGPWRLAARRLRRNKIALVFGAIFILIVVLALCAPLFANHVADTGPNTQHLGAADRFEVDGKQVDPVSLEGVPVGPQWFGAGGKYVLGADQGGRDVAVRLLYGARNTLIIGLTASLITMVFSVILGLLAGYYRGWVDAIISRWLDILWAFPVLLLGIALGVALALGGLNLGIIEVRGNSLWIPTLIIGFVSIVYLARTLRGQVLSLREKEFVEAARAQGASDRRIMFGELLPNVASTILVFLPILLANAIVLEAALSFLNAGVRPPNPSWGTMLGEGIDRIITAPHLTIVPGAMLALTVLAVNVFGDGVRDALDPRATIKLDR
jgi:peptide/nickel transport system permease protein